MAAERAGVGLWEPSPPPAPPLLSPWITALCAVVLVALAALAVWPVDGLALLELPEASLERVVGREMDFRAAAREASAWERALYAAVFASAADARADALNWYDELLEDGGSLSLAQLQWLVLLAEDGRDEQLAAALEEWQPIDDEAARLSRWARAAYGPAPGPDELRDALRAVRAELPAGWFTDRLVAQLAGRLGDRAAEAAAEVATRARGHTLLWRHRALLGLELGLLAVGVTALVALSRRGGAGPQVRVGPAPLPPPWPLLDGLGLFARGGAGLVAVAALGTLLPPGPPVAAAISLASAVPLLAYAAAYPRWRGLSPAETFGLTVDQRALGALGRVSVGLVGLATLADLVVEAVGARLDVAPHWTDGFQEQLVWGTTADVAADVLDSVIVAPVAEELLFRGILYATLRTRLAPVPAAGVSGLVFALAHGYGVVGFGAVLASGVLWALAYERTRSLLPAILAHAAGNLLATAIVLATLRF